MNGMNGMNPMMNGVNAMNQYPQNGFGGFQTNGYGNGMMQPQPQPVVQPIVNGFGSAMNGNPFSTSGNMKMNTQMTFTAASLAERNRLKQMEMRNDSNVNAFGG